MSRWSEYKEKNGVTPLDMLNPNTKKAGLELSEQRFSICKGCPEFMQLTSQCKKCGCVMSIKTKLEAAKCPMGKW
jgi:hypothetical protein